MFLFTEKDDLILPCANAVTCAYSMITIIQHGMNLILDANGYPELGIRIGIDIGENAIVQYGLRPEIITTTETGSNNDEMKWNETNDDRSNSGMIKKKMTLLFIKSHTWTF